MPTYEYACRNCGHRFDIVQKMIEDSLAICPECGGELRKVFAAPAISFKGSGFYATDHGKKSKSSGGTGGSDKDKDKKPAEKSGEKQDSASSGSGDKSEPKPEKKSETKTESSGSKKDGGSST